MFGYTKLKFIVNIEILNINQKPILIIMRYIFNQIQLWNNEVQPYITGNNYLIEVLFHSM